MRKEENRQRVASRDVRQRNETETQSEARKTEGEREMGAEW